MIPEYRHRALDRSKRIPFPIRVRLLLIVPGSHRWNGWVRGLTARWEENWSQFNEAAAPSEETT